jgi:ABC-type multidrug transport system fused ATPase/permease subunit
MRRFLPYIALFKPVRWHLAAGLLFGLIYGAASGFGLPYMMKTVFPRVFTEVAPTLTSWEIFQIALWLPFIFTIRGVADYLNTYLIQYCGTRVLEQLRLKFFSKLQVLPLSFLQRNSSGDNISRGMSDANQLQSTMSNLANVLVKQPATREVRAFGLEDREISRFGTSTNLLLTYQMKVVKYAKALPPAIGIISAFGLSATFVYAYRSGLSKDAFLALIMALYVCYEPIKKLAALSNDTKRGAAALDRLEFVLNEPVSITDPAAPVPIDRPRGDPAFDGVTFAYKNDEPALRDVSIAIPAGTTCALVGPGGAGKSTFANPVPRFHDAASGRVTLDGIDVRDLRLADLRANIAVVSQYPFLSTTRSTTTSARPRRRHPRRGRAGRPRSQRPRLHPVVAQWIRHPRRRTRRVPLRRTTPARRPGPRLPAPRPRPHPRRSRQRPRQRERVRHPAGPQETRRRQDGPHHRPPFQHHPRRLADPDV